MDPRIDHLPHGRVKNAAGAMDRAANRALARVLSWRPDAGWKLIFLGVSGALLLWFWARDWLFIFATYGPDIWLLMVAIWLVGLRLGARLYEPRS